MICEGGKMKKNGKKEKRLAAEKKKVEWTVPEGRE